MNRKKRSTEIKMLAFRITIKIKCACVVISMSKDREIYSGFEICNDLQPNQKCFRVRLYKEGRFRDKFHEHIPKHRISQQNAIDCLKTLVIRCLDWRYSYILGTYLNN